MNKRKLKKILDSARHASQGVNPSKDRTREYIMQRLNARHTTHERKQAVKRMLARIASKRGPGWNE